MRVTIDGITYEGTPEEIRDIVENPPVRKGAEQNIDCPDNDRINYPTYPTYPTYPAYPYPTNPTYPSDITWNYYKKNWENWDGSPAVTCCVGGDFLC